MIPVSNFFPRVLPFVLGCSDPLAAQAVVDAAIVFCEDSLAIRQVLDPITVSVAGGNEYTIDTPMQQSITRVLTAWIDGVQIAVNPQDQISQLRTDTGKPVGCYTRRIDSTLTVVVYPIPDASYTLTVECAMRPVRGAAQLENDLYDLWVEPISSGALSRLASIPDQPFTNLGLATAHLNLALRGSSKARVESSYNRTRGTQTVRPRPMA